MQLEALEIFCDVARLRSFSQAARAHGVTQSAVSQVVSQLEARVQARLIDRSTRPLRLTPPGQTYYDGCKAMLAQFAEMEAAVRGTRAEDAGTVQVAAIYSVGLGDLGQFVRRFIAEQPHAQVHIEYHHPDKVYQRVLDGTADLGLVSFPHKTPRLTALPWKEEEMVLACAPAHPLAQRLSVRPAELAGAAYVHFERNLAVRRQVDRFFKGQGIAVEVVLEFDNIENIKQAVALNAGVALLPEPTVRREVQARSLAARPLHGCRFTRPLGIVHRRQRLGAAARRFVELLQGQVPEQADPPAPQRRSRRTVGS